VNQIIPTTTDSIWVATCPALDRRKQFGHLSSGISTAESGLTRLLQGISIQDLTTADTSFGGKTDQKNPLLFIYSSHLLLSCQINIISLEQTKAIKN